MIGKQKHTPLFLILFCFLSSFSSPALAKRSMFFANKIPDFSQTEIEEEIHGYGRAYCAPTAASNVFRWLHSKRVHQGKLIKLLASPDYMDTDINRGTTFYNFMEGVARYMDDELGGYKSLLYQGLGYVEQQYDTGVLIPDLDWIADGLGMKKATWLRLGYYDYNERKNEYERREGHIVNLVGYEYSPRKNFLVIHDPGAPPDKSIKNVFLDIHFLEDGVINYGGADTLPAEGHLSVKNGEDIYPGADIVLIEGAIRLETH